MPKLLRQVEQDVSVEDLNTELAEFGQTVLQEGAFLYNADGSRGDEIEDGDVLVPSDATYQSGIVAPETNVVVIKTVPEAGIVWGAFYRPDGQKGLQFFVPQSFKEKFGEGDTKPTTTKTTGKKAR